jgi:hypothetical protein
MNVSSLRTLKHGDIENPANKNRIFQSFEEVRALDLLRRNPRGVAVAELAQALEVGDRLPAVRGFVCAWKRRAMAKKMNLSELLVRERVYQNGKTTGVYRLTQRGREYFEDTSLVFWSVAGPYRDKDYPKA